MPTTSRPEAPPNTQEGQETIQLLRAYRAGDVSAEAALFDRLYTDLHRIARRRSAREPSEATLAPTSLVHETYLRLSGSRQDVGERAAFLRLAATVMGHILVDRARGRARRARLVMDRPDTGPSEGGPELYLSEALERLRERDEELARIAELRFLMGLDVAQTAAELSLSPATVKRGWRTARAFLARELEA